MPELYPGLSEVLLALGGAHPLLVGVPAAVGVLWALARWADEASARSVRRLAGVAALLLGAGLLLRLGMALNSPRPLMPAWQWLIGLLVLPLLIRLPRFGGAAAMLFFLCLAAALGSVVGWVADPRVVTASALLLGAITLAAALVWRRIAPPPPPAPVEPQVLHQRLDTDEAREGADKYTRE